MRPSSCFVLCHYAAEHVDREIEVSQWRIQFF